MTTTYYIYCNTHNMIQITMKYFKYEHLLL